MDNLKTFLKALEKELFKNNFKASPPPPLISESTLRLLSPVPLLTLSPPERSGPG